jgi:proline racemase
MSGSNTMCAVTAALENGIVPITGPEVEITIDTAVGTVKAIAHTEGRKVLSVTVVNVPAFVVGLDMPLEVPEFGTVRTDVVFGGQFFAQVRAADLGLELAPDNGRQLVRAGALIKLAAHEQLALTHPVNPALDRVNLVMLHDGDRVPGRESRNTVVLTNGVLDKGRPETWTGALDRSPCGTGTSARMAALHARGQLAIGEDFVHHSIIGSTFVGHLTAETTVGDRPAVLPTITGRAWVTGRATWVMDPNDPYQEGYTVGDIWAPRDATAPRTLKGIN